MPYPAEGLYPSPLLYPLEAGVEFVNFTKDFTRFVTRYGRMLKNHRTNTSFRAMVTILKGSKCLGDGRTMECGDAIAYVVPGLSYEIGDHISPVSGRGEWIIVTERYASRIGELRIFRALALERYTPGVTLIGAYTIVEPATVGVDIIGLYDLTEDLVSLEMLSRYDINALDVSGIVLAGLYNLTEDLVSLEMLSRYDINALDVPGIVLAGLYNLTEDLVSLEMLSRYDIIALDAAYPATTLYPSTSLYPRGPGRAADIMSVEFVGVYVITEEIISLEMLSRYDINALEAPGIELAGKYALTEELVSLEMCCIYDIIAKEVKKEMISLYNITKTPAQVAGERAVATGDMIDNYWNPWDDEDLSYYKVHRSLNNGFAPSDANLVGVPSTNAFKHINLAAATQYYFKVCAVTKLGVSGTYSAQFTATTA